MVVCEVCGGCGELRDPLGGTFRCPDCGGARRLNGVGSDRAASASGAVSIAIPHEVWGRVVEAGRLNGRKASAWAVDALDNAARHQVRKASKKRGSGAEPAMGETNGFRWGVRAENHRPMPWCLVRMWCLGVQRCPG